MPSADLNLISAVAFAQPKDAAKITDVFATNTGAD